ncbi:MAG TPA: DUF192 domain-containing protein [Acidimicrobiia bacterium]|nr:DUF192 domain-containing protein [Acidimicrobiia bacterium]
MLALAACSGSIGSQTPTTTATSPPATPGTTAPVTETTVSSTVGDQVGFPITDVSVGDTELRVWVADDGAERSQGLRRVAALPGDIDGMLFVWDSPTETAFVMEDTLIPLDVWFFDDEGALVGTHAMTPCAEEPCPTYPTPGPVRWALETPLGARQFEEGARLTTSPSG